MAEVAPGGMWSLTSVAVPAHSYMRKMRASESSAFLIAVRVTLGFSMLAQECSAGRVPVWGKTCCGFEWVVEFVAAADGLGLLPGAGVRVEGVAELLAAFVGDFVGPGGGAEEGEAEGVACGVVAVLGVVEDGEALLGVAEVGPAHGGDFELGFLPGVVAGGGALDGAVGDFVGGLGCRWRRVGRRL